MENTSVKINNLIESGNNFLLITHRNPDGDAVSSVCAMAEYLDNKNKEFLIYCIDSPPIQFDFLPHFEKFTSDKKSFDFFDFDRIIILDCGAQNRFDLGEEFANKKRSQVIINIDHHIKIDDFADIELRDDKAASTTEILYLFFQANNIKINKKIANCILVGILTDTANFLYPSTSDRTVKISSEMLARGANLSEIVENSWRNKSLASMKIWGKALENLNINKKYNFGISLLTQEDIERSGVNEEELEGVAGFLSNLQGVKGIILLKEEKGGMIKGSIRTAVPGLDISKLARMFGGGGHAKAAGFRIFGRLEKTNGNWQII